MMPGILQQMGADNLQSLRKLAEQLPAETRNAVAGQAGAADDDEEGKAPLTSGLNAQQTANCVAAA